jgi:hypothetical protein
MPGPTPNEDVRVMRLLQIDRAAAYPAVRTRCCPVGITRPVLRLNRDGSTSLIHGCVSCGIGKTRPSQCIVLPGFKTGRDLARWLAWHQVLEIDGRTRSFGKPGQPEWDDEIILSLDAAAGRMIRCGRDIRAWQPTAREVLDLVGWIPGDPGVTISRVRKALKATAFHDHLYLEPGFDFGVATAGANRHIDWVEANGQRGENIRIASDPTTEPERLFQLAGSRDPHIRRAILTNPAAPDEAKVLAALTPVSDTPSKCAHR